MVNDAVAKRISKLLQEKNMSQYRLEQESGIQHGSMQCIMNGRNKMVTLSTVMLIAKVFHMSLTEFLNDEIFGSEELDIEFKRTVAVKLEAEDENDEYLLVTDNCIDIGEPIVEETILSIPSILLCSEDCKGLCQKCGKNLNSGNCGCPEHDFDPRWAKLKNLFGNRDGDK